MDTTPERRRTRAKHGSTGAWKERFRQGCVQRLRSKRQDYVNTLRNTNECKSPHSPASSQEYVSKVMLEEWKQMKLESPIPSSSSHPRGSKRRNDFDSDDEDDYIPDSIEGVLDYFEEIQRELMREEERMLAQYEDMVSFNDQYICEAIDMLSTNSVMCPVCKKKNLLQNKQIIFCACGIRVDTQTDSIDLNYIGKQLQISVDEHSGSCQQVPVFHMADLSGVGIQNLVLSCQACDALTIII